MATVASASLFEMNRCMQAGDCCHHLPNNATVSLKSQYRVIDLAGSVILLLATLGRKIMTMYETEWVFVRAS